ncbi:putative tRNA pseudouridine synthase A-like 3, partial [Homarus americanus]
MASSKENSGDGESLCQGVSMKRASASERTETQVKRINLDASSEVEGGETVRRKRRKYALLLSYSGKGYLGMQ